MIFLIFGVLFISVGIIYLLLSFKFPKIEKSSLYRGFLLTTGGLVIISGILNCISDNIIVPDQIIAYTQDITEDISVEESTVYYYEKGTDKSKCITADCVVICKGTESSTQMDDTVCIIEDETIGSPVMKTMCRVHSNPLWYWCSMDMLKKDGLNDPKLVKSYFYQFVVPPNSIQQMTETEKSNEKSKTPTQDADIQDAYNETMYSLWMGHLWRNW